MIRGIVLTLLFLSFGLRISPPAKTSVTNLVNFAFARFRRPVSCLFQSLDKTPSLPITVCLLLAGDIELNPGPRNVYLCALCDLEVSWNCKALCCDGCDVWIHHACVDINSLEYSLLGKSAVPWLCPRCDNMNCDTFTFNSFEISCHNSFNPLSQAPLDSDTNRSIASASIFSPKCTSSPNPPANHCRKPSSVSSLNSPSVVSRDPSHDQSSVYSLPSAKKTNLRVLNMNCQSIRNKRSELHASLNYIKPDIVCATETLLRGIQPGKPPTTDSISSSEFSTDDYNIFRNDRTTIGGGVLIMAHKSLTVEEQPHLVTDCELNWIKIKLKNLKDLYIGVFYMPHRNAKAINELNKSLDLLSKDGAK